MTTEATTNGDLDAKHRAELHASGIGDSLIEHAGIRSAENAEIRKLLGWQVKARDWDGGMVIPFLGIDGKPTGYSRIKLDHPRGNPKGEPIKYESPRKLANRAYFPPGFSVVKSGDLLVTEGEKKTLSAVDAGFPCIGLVGVWAWQVKRLRDDNQRAYGKRRLIPELHGIDWRDRNVFIVFDSDAVDNPQIQLAEARLAAELKGRRAAVKLVRLPKLGEDGKTGLDDFLVHYGEQGPSELRKLMAEADEAEAPEKLGPMDFARALVAEEFAGPQGMTLIWHREEFQKHTGTHYAKIEGAELTARVLAWLDERSTSTTPRQAADVVKCLQPLTIQPFRREAPFWTAPIDGAPSPKNVIAFHNGLLDATNVGGALQMMEHTPKFYSPSALPYPFDAEADCPEWEQFLKSSLVDEDRIRLLQKYVGLLLTEDTSYQVFLMMVGPTRSGKGTICKVIQHVMGDSVCASPTLTSLASDFGLWPLVGKRVALIQDAHLGRRADDARILETLKSVIGEDPQDIQRKYMTTLCSVRLSTRFLIVANELPHFYDSSGALLARLLLLTFDKSFAGREDRGLAKRLMGEASGILNWALRGLHMLRTENGFHVPAASRDMLGDFRRYTSPVAAFVEDVCRVAPGLSVPVDELFAEWQQWTEANGHKAGSKVSFGEKLRNVDSQIKRSRPRDSEGRRVPSYANIAVRSDYSAK